MAKTPEDAALAAVAKAITDELKATEKLAAAEEKFLIAKATQVRAARTTKWAASHPDLPEGFDLETFRTEQLTPFEDDVDPIEPDEDEIAAVQEGLAELNDDVSEDRITIPDDASEIVDDPFGDDEPAETPQARRR